jgi:osmotically-inducible protein OsmY
MGKARKRAGLLAALCLAGCSSEDTDGLARVASKSAARFEVMTGGAPAKLAASFDTMRANFNEMALDARVSMRLRWDKDLQKSSIQVQAKNGVVELKGTVVDLSQRQRAVQLARSTVGVVEVVDELVVEELP